MVDVHALSLGPIGTNCYLLRAPASDACAVVDPGAEHERVLALVEELELSVTDILVTHCHWDHVGAVADLGRATGAPVWMSTLEAPVLEEPERFAIPGLPQVDAWPVAHRLDGGERIEVADGTIVLDVLLVPGHSPAHLAFVEPGIRDASGSGYDVAPTCAIGDVIFQGSIGRTDLPFADPDVMRSTLGRLAARLAPETVLLPGHGPTTTMATELASNPFLRA